MATGKPAKSTSRRRGAFVRLRPRVVAGLALLGVLGFAGHQLWQRFAPTVADHPQYLVTADQVHIPEAPDWIRSDIRSEVLRDAGFGGSVSLLDDNRVLARIKSAFEFHPWVARVDRVSKRLPAGIDVQLQYRRPLVAVETIGARGSELLVVDAEIIRLPELDLSEPQRRYLPRITGLVGKPPVGQRWDDPRVIAGVRLAEQLAPTWEELRLMEIVPLQANPESPDALSFHILTTGGTRVIWGAAPGEEPAEESPFAAKLGRLREYATAEGRLDTIEGPQTVDVRHQLIVVPRPAKRTEAKLAVDPGSSTKSLPGTSAEVAVRDQQENIER